MSEVGYSHESAVWGGTLIPIVTGRAGLKKRPIMALQRRNWPNFNDHFKTGVSGAAGGRYKRYRNHARFVPGKRFFESWPIPVYWMEQMMNKDFWEAVVPRYGAEVLRSPETMGWILKDVPQESREYKMTFEKKTGPDFLKWIEFSSHFPRSISAVPIPDADAKSQEMWVAANNRRMRATAINIATRMNGVWRREWVVEKEMGEEMQTQLHLQGLDLNEVSVDLLAKGIV